MAAIGEDAERRMLADDLARWAGEAGEAGEAEHDRSVAEDTSYGVPLTHGAHCCARARDEAGRDEFRFAMELPIDKLRRRHSAELEERAVERARREGVLPTP